MTTVKMETGREILRKVRYSRDLVMDGKREIVLMEGYFHQWFVDDKAQLQAVVEIPEGTIVLIDFDDLCFID